MEEEGDPAYHPSLLLKVWLYAFTLVVTSSWRLGLEQRLWEDLAFRYLAGGAKAGFLGAERVLQAAWASNERGIHAGGGTAAIIGYR
jgi:transposase